MFKLFIYYLERYALTHIQNIIKSLYLAIKGNCLIYNVSDFFSLVILIETFQMYEGLN